MVLLLNLVVAAILILLGYFVVTQFILPAIFGRRLFPAFRTDPLKEKVNQTREQVGDLKDQTESLTELQTLLKQRNDLQQKIDELEKPAQAETSKE